MAMRSFLAFELPRAIKETLSAVSGEMKRFPLDLRWVKVDNIHLTVVFLGNIRPEQRRGVEQTVEKVCKAFGPFDMALSGTGVFANRRHPRVLWVGLVGDVDRMGRFREYLQEGLAPIGIRQEKRPYRPHLTLARFRKGSRPGAPLDQLLEAYEGFQTPPWPLDELILFRSDLQPRGAVYTRLASWPLIGEQ
jgi:2'-5' RNA ligase